MFNIVDNKIGLVMGVANDRSIAWHISMALKNHGAELIFSAPNDTLINKIRKIAGDDVDVIKCDVSSEEDIVAMCGYIKNKYGKIDFIVHSLAYSDKDELSGQFYKISKQNFINALDISCYSLTAICREAVEADILNDAASIVTMSYIGAVRTVPHYNVMGIAKAALEASVKYLAVDLGPKNIRINAISAGPMRTIAAHSISDFGEILSWNEENSPLRRNINDKDVAGTGLYLLSDLSSGVTGSVIYVDCGYNVVGMRKCFCKKCSTN